MMRVIDLRQVDVQGMRVKNIEALLPRAKFDISAAVEKVRPMLDRIKVEGDTALYDFARQFDGIEQDPKSGGSGIRVDAAELKSAFDSLAPELVTALEEAKNRITKTHQDQMPQETVTHLAQGARVFQKFKPVRRVGLYVPGGVAVYPSSVLMNAIPAQVAGVESIVIASPGQSAFGGLPHPTILAACHLLGISEVIAVGGAGAVGALAFGTESVEPVDVITGPGNIFVASAKMLVQGVVGIDAIAGPTEIMILADDSADPKFVAADLIGQAEHDNLAGSVLVTNSEELANQVQGLLPAMVAQTMSSERVETALAGQQSAIMLVKNVQDGVAVANAYGAEHLELHTRQPEETAEAITNAGAVFIGEYSPVSLGDYIGGSNHVLPTNGSSKFSQGLSVFAFLRSQQQIEYTKSALEQVADKIYVLSENEQLPAHGEAVAARF